MYTSFSQFYKLLEHAPKARLVVAAAHDSSVLNAIKEACLSGLVDPILIGNKEKIKSQIYNSSFSYDLEIINETNDNRSAEIAVELINTGEADILMKGIINSSDFLKAVVNKNSGLIEDTLLSHLAAFEIPGIKKLSFYSDGGMNLYPDLIEKKQILINSLKILHSIGIECPKVAVLTANEQINPKMQSTVDAAALAKMCEDGLLKNCIVEGPIALDVALSADAAAHKGVYSKISGDVDLFIVPNIEAGNMIGKSLVYYAGAKMAGVILGASCPIVLTSRSDNSAGKLNSIALACVINTCKKKSI